MTDTLHHTHKYCIIGVKYKDSTRRCVEVEHFGYWLKLKKLIAQLG